MIVAADFFERRIPERVQQWPELRAALKEIVQVTITGPKGGSWCCDFSKEQVAVTPGRGDAHVELECSQETLDAIISGQLDAHAAFLAGQLKVSGYLDTALKLGRLLSSFAPT